MDLLQPTVGGAVLAALAVAVGAPIFGDGLRTLRLRRAFARLRESALPRDAEGLVRANGRVVLESPLFGPLSARPCAAFRLEIRTPDGRLAAAIEERRPFRLVAEGGSAAVAARGGSWALPAVAERVVDREQPGTAGVAALIERSPEARWLRAAGVRLTLVERTLAAGALCRVTGFARQVRAGEEAVEAARLRTGTDDVEVPPAGAPASALPRLVLDDGEAHEYLHVVADGTESEPLPSLLRMTGLLTGPALGLAGLLYLARVAEGLRPGSP